MRGEGKRLEKKFLELHFIVFLWGFTAVLGKLVPMDAMVLVWYRIGISIPVLAFWIWKSGHSFALTKKQWLKYALGGVLITLHWISFFTAIKVSNVSLTLVVLSTGAFFTAIFDPIVKKKKIRFHEVWMGLLISVGVYMIFKITSFNIAGFLWALAAAFLSAFYSIVNGIHAKENPGSKISFYQLSIGWVLLGAYIGLSSPASFSVDMQWQEWGYLLLLSVVCTSYPIARSISLMRYVSPYSLMLAVNMEPVYGIILALLIFGEEERMPALFYLGALLIFSLVIWNARKKINQGKVDDM